MENNYFNWNEDYLNIMAIIGFTLGLYNVELNQKQISNDEIMEQAKDNANRIETQNEKYLNIIIDQNKKILEILKGGKK